MRNCQAPNWSLSLPRIKERGHLTLDGRSFKASLQRRQEAARLDRPTTVPTTATATKRQGEGNSQAKKGTENESGSEVGRWVAGGCGAPSTPTQPKHGCGPGCPPSRPMAWARGNTHCRAPSPMAGGPQGHTPRASPAGAILHHQEGAESGELRGPDSGLRAVRLPESV